MDVKWERKVERIPEAGCWIWMGSLNNMGYGQIRERGSGSSNRLLLAHRFTYEQLIGPIPEGLVLDHLCRVACCVNPAHLEPVTQRTNLRRGAWATKTHCKYGHLLVDRRKNGTRRCLQCNRKYNQKRKPKST